MYKHVVWSLNVEQDMALLKHFAKQKKILPDLTGALSTQVLSSEIVSANNGVHKIASSEFGIRHSYSVEVMDVARL